MNRQTFAGDPAGVVVYVPAKGQPNPKKAYEERIRRFYDAVSNRPLLTKRTRYMNMGYWDGETPTLDDACEALARFVGAAADFGPDDRILDVGNGFGDQDISWVRDYTPRKITAINISEVQVQLAQRRVELLGLQGRIELHLGSATDLPFAEGSFDKVVSIESAQHFATREDFFCEAHRVLRPRGRICTTDIIPMPNAAISNFALNAMSLTRDNMYPRDVYAAKLEGAGFTDVCVTSIRDLVLVPFKQHLDRTAADAALVERLLRKIRKLLIPPSKLDYVIATARKR